MSIQALADKIREAEFVNLTADEKIVAINELLVSIQEPVLVADILTYGIKEGFWADVDIGRDDPDLQKKKLCRNVMAWVDTKSTIDMNDEKAQMMLGGLQLFGIITQEQAAEIVAMGTKQVRWVDHVGLGTVGLGFLQQAEALA